MTTTTAYRVLAYLLALSVAVQASLIALAIFAIALLAGRRVPKTAAVAEPSRG